ncbi:hypothetical protein pb186bvf_008295 [Paramecium bursaria]
MGSQIAVQDQCFSLIEFDPDIRVSVRYQYQDNLSGVEQFYKVNGEFQLDEFIKYLEAIGSIPKFEENQVCISSFLIGTEEYFEEESRNFRQLNVHDNSKIIIKLERRELQNQSMIEQTPPIGIDTPELLQNDERDFIIKDGQMEHKFQSFPIVENNSQDLTLKQKPIVQRQNTIFQQNIEKPINNVVALTQTEKSLLEEINNSPSLIKQNIININPNEYKKNQELLKIIKQEEEVVLDNFQYQQNVKKQEDKSFKIIEQQKYHKIENAIKRRIVENQKNNQIINPLTINQQQVLQDNNQELIMFVLADQMKSSGKVLYQSKESEKLNIYSLQASFSDQCEDTICEKLTLQETPKLKFNQLRDDNIQEKKFYTSIREILAKQYNVKLEDVNILSIESGSISVKYKITRDYSDAEKAKQYTINEINKLFPGSNPVLAIHKYFESIQLSPNDFDPKYNMEWINFPEYELRGPPKDQIKYFFPKGWKGYALKVQGRYDNGNDDWLLMNSNPSQWHIMYHGTTNLGCKGIKQTGFIAGAGQAFSNHTDIRFNKTIGVGIYFSNHIEVAEQYCRQTTVIDNHHYKVVFMSRVRPTSLKQARKQSDIPGKQGNLDWDNDYFVVNKPEDIRPYRILLKKI